MEEFSVSLWNKITEDVERLVRSTPPPWIAAFDADGTLWDTDVGESFFDYQIEHCNLKLPPDPWDHYISLKTQHMPTAFLWLAQISAGQTLAQMNRWTNEWFESIKNGFPFFESQRQLIKHLHQMKVDVYVVSASVQWCIEPAAAQLGIKKDKILGVKTKVVNGVITSDVDGHVTWQEGKAQELLRNTNGVRPIFCSGNTPGDLKLLEISKGPKLAVSSPRSPVLSAEKSLFEKAVGPNWHTHIFR